VGTAHSTDVNEAIIIYTDCPIDIATTYRSNLNHNSLIFSHLIVPNIQIARSTMVLVGNAHPT
jgi:hypothetical protein